MARADFHPWVLAYVMVVFRGGGATPEIKKKKQGPWAELDKYALADKNQHRVSNGPGQQSENTDMHITLRKSTSGSSMVLKPAASMRSACLTKSGPSAFDFMRYISSNFKQNGTRPCVSFGFAFRLGARMGPIILIVKFKTSWAYICSAARSWLHAHVVACSFACVNGEWYIWIHLVTPHYVKS